MRSGWCVCGIDSHLKLVTTLLLLLAAVVAAELATECGQQLQKAGVATLTAPGISDGVVVAG